MRDDVKAKLILESWKFEPIDEDDDVYTMEEWIKICKGGGFIDLDGMGSYAIDGERATIPVTWENLYDPYIYPSDAVNGNLDMRFTHVVWFNK